MTKEKSVKVDSPVFLYDQVKMGIMEMIQKEELVSGQKLPSEKELIETFNTSRITIRRALKELENEGIIEIIHGKGTFVKSFKQKIHILNLQGFTDGLSTSESSFTKEVLVNQIEIADEKLMELFEREEPFEVVRLVRLIKMETVLLVLTTLTYLVMFILVFLKKLRIMSPHLKLFTMIME